MSITDEHGYTGYGETAQGRHPNCKECRTKVIHHLLEVYKRIRKPKIPMIPYID